MFSYQNQSSSISIVYYSNEEFFTFKLNLVENLNPISINSLITLIYHNQLKFCMNLERGEL